MATYDGHTLTREGMEQVIAERGSVLFSPRFNADGSVAHPGGIVQHVAHLPSEADLAKGQPHARRVLAALDGRIADLLAQRADLAESVAPAEPTPSKGSKAKADADKAEVPPAPPADGK